ncbi:MAG: tRNA (adenosine(37)-N6)-threonylcarbamoyltransferase complex ATPase subunit type 1 TsaE [Chlamydiales bacterium]
MGRSRIETASDEETIAFGCRLGKLLKPNTLVCLFGELGTGKTTLVKGIAKGVNHTAPEEVHSPTFSYLNVYGAESHMALYHFDLYRLNDVDEFLSLGFEEYFFAGGICCIEWSERIASILPPKQRNQRAIFLSHMGENRRMIEL